MATILSRQHDAVNGATGVQPARLEFIDNLRWVMIVLVISMHAAVTYSHLGSWYFMEDPKPGLGVTIGFAAYQTFLQAFFMGFLFLIAGYFVPAAYDRKGFGRFLRDRAIRLGIPSLFYMLVVHPLVVNWMLKDYYKITASFSTRYWNYIRTLDFLGSSGPMWFTVALLIFCLIYGVLRLSRGGVPGNQPAAALPTHSQVVALAFVMGLCTFLVRIVQPMGKNILNMQLCYFSDYILLFSVGILAWRRNWLQRIPHGFGMRWFVLALTAGSAVWFGIIAATVTSHTTDMLGGGFTWQSAALSFWEAFFCVGICLGLTVLFRERFNHQGRAAKWLSDNCFSVYLFHTPLLIAVTLAMRGFIAPKPIKFLVATLLACIITWSASSLIFRRIPLLRRVL
jgi:fucose 4-O-acetylase-like acetyltransferase